MSVALVILVVYMVVLYGISWYSTKLSKKGGIIGYLLANRGLPTIVVATMVAGLAIGGASTVGVAQNAYGHGLSAGMYNAAWGAGAIIVGLIAAAKFRKLEITTIPELFERYYTKGGRIVGVIGQIILQIVITSLQYIAGGAVLSALLPQYFSFSTGMLVTAVMFVGITLIGGYWAAGLSNVINVIVIYIGIILGVITAVHKYGGFASIASQLPASVPWFSPVRGLGLSIVVAWFVVMITQAHSLQAVVQIAFASKDGKIARNGFILGGILILPIGFLAAIFGIIAAAKFPGLSNAAMALPKVVLSLSPVVAGITLAGLWAADVSTAVGLLLGSATLVVNDIWKPYVKHTVTEKEGMLISRLTVLILSVLTYILATSIGSILNTLTTALAITCSYAILLLGPMYFPKLCKKSSAIWTISVSMLVLVIWMLVPSTHIVPQVIYLEWPICILTFLLVSIFDKNRASIPSLQKTT